MFRTEQSSVNPTDVASIQLMSYTSAHGKVNHHLVLYHHYIGEGATQSKTVDLLYLVHTYNQDEPTVRPAITGLQHQRYNLSPAVVQPIEPARHRTIQPAVQSLTSCRSTHRANWTSYNPTSDAISNQLSHNCNLTSCGLWYNPSSCRTI